MIKEKYSFDFINHIPVALLKNKQSYKKGQVLFFEGDMCEHLTIVLDGYIEIKTYLIDGKTIWIKDVLGNECIGAALIFAELSEYPGNIEAKEDSTVVMLDKDTLSNLLAKDDLLMQDYLRLLSAQIMDLNANNKLLRQKTIKDKIMFYLHEQSRILHTDIIPIDGGKEKLANILNIERPSLSRELINLKKEKVIDYDKYYFYIKKK